MTTISLLGLLAFASFQESPQDPVRLLPLAPRNRWTYEVQGGDEGEMRVLRRRKYSGKVYWVVEFKTGAFTETRHLRVDESGIQQRFYSIRTRSAVTRVPADDPVYELVFPPDPGRSWELRLTDGRSTYRKVYRILARRKIDTPAGTFRSVGVELTGYRDDVKIEQTVTWYAGDVGIVQIEKRTFDAEGRTREETVYRLKGYRVKVPEGDSGKPPPDPGALADRTRSVLATLAHSAVQAEDPESIHVLVSLYRAVGGEDTELSREEEKARGWIGSREPRSMAKALEKQIRSAGSGLSEAYRLLHRHSRDPTDALRGMLFETLAHHILALKKYNRIRIGAGLEPVLWDWELSRGAMLHARYLAATGMARARRAMDLHSEDPGSPYYSKAGARAGLGGMVASGPVDEVIDALMATFYHRVQMLKPNLRRIGTGMWTSGIDLAKPSVIDVSAGVQGPSGSKPIPYPPPGSTGVDVAFARCGELPKPVPGRDETKLGYPVTLTFPNGIPKNVEARLLKGAEEVECLMSCADKPTNPEVPCPGTICLLPAAPLQPRSKYTVKIACTLNGEPFALEWSFRTR